MIFFILSCNDLSKEKDNTKKNIFEREKRLISEYHKKAVKIRGKKEFYIPKEEIHWYFKEENFIPINDAKIGDNVSFFDTIGNIQYQVLIIDIDDNEIVLECLDLEKIKYYTTTLNIDSIHDLENNYPYKIRIYRDNLFDTDSNFNSTNLKGSVTSYKISKNTNINH